MNAVVTSSEKPVPLRDILDIRTGDTAIPEKLYRFIIGSFGTGQEERYRILKLSALNGEEYRNQTIDIASVVSECMIILTRMIPSPLGTIDSLERELFKNLLTTKLMVEWVEIKRARLTSDVVGEHALSMWMEKQVDAVPSIEDEHSTSIRDSEETTDPGVLQARVEALDAVVEEWVVALDRYDLALRELMLLPEESVATRFASFVRQTKDPLDRTDVVAK